VRLPLIASARELRAALIARLFLLGESLRDVSRAIGTA